MATISIEEARRIYFESFTAYQKALAAVAIGRTELRNAVTRKELTPGTPEYLAAEQQLVTSAESAANAAKLERTRLFNQLDLLTAREQTARDIARNNELLLAEQSAPIATEASTNLLPNQNQGTPTPAPTPIIGAGEIDAGPDFVQTGTGLNVLSEESVDNDRVTLFDLVQDSENDPFARPPVGEDDLVFLNTGQNLGASDESGFVTDPVTGLNVLPQDVPVDEVDGYLTEFTPEGSRVLTPAEVEEASLQAAARDRARQQQTIAQQRRQINNGDWRVRLRLAPQAKYLYNAPNPGILQPLQITDGVIFPYTPTITTGYRANYSSYDLTHSNYRGYFYQNSYVEPIQLSCQFTAQSTAEANYLLAVIQFFKSVTKMFYGQDAERGAPPPLTYLTGLGEYQFNEHPCVVAQFNYNLPADVDYIRAGSPNQLGLNLVNQRDRQTVSTGSLFGGLNRLAAALLTKGAIPDPPAPSSLSSNRPTYVPTKIEIAITLLPIQSRNQISKQFSLKEFSNGNLIKGGFW
jgi:hypothetical protein